MELREKNGEIIWVKKDGSPAKRKVSDQRRITYCGFPLPFGGCKSLSILAGDPLVDDVILVEAGGVIGMVNFSYPRRMMIMSKFGMRRESSQRD